MVPVELANHDLKCFQTWKYYLASSYVQVQSDHSPLKWMQTQSKLTDKVVRWLDFLSEFHFDVVHVPGTRTPVADALSRRPDFYDMASLSALRKLTVRHVWNSGEFLQLAGRYQPPRNAEHSPAAVVAAMQTVQ